MQRSGWLHNLQRNLPENRLARSVHYTRHDQRETVSRNALARLTERYPDLPLAVIRTSSEFSKVLAAGETIFSRNARNSAREDYDRHVSELLEIAL